MNKKFEDSDEKGVSILEAVETLSEIADLEILPHIGFTEPHKLTIGKQAFTYKSIEWAHKEELEEKLVNLREVFTVILEHLKHFYKNSGKRIKSQHGIDGIKSIMVLVGEAAKKLDRFTNIFHLSTGSKPVTEWKEYKQLQDFYLSKVARHIDEGIISKWIYNLAKTAFSVEAPNLTISEKGLQTKHIFVDMEAVKKDLEYELFFLRKEDGSRFYNPKLLRNMKLVCDFGDYTQEEKEDDPLSDLIKWQDSEAYLSCKELTENLKQTIAEFYKESAKQKGVEIVEILKKCLMALTLGSHPTHLIKNNPVKTCLEYFEDFKNYLRDAMQTREYEKWLAYGLTDDFSKLIVNTIDAICFNYLFNIKREDDYYTKSLLKEAYQGISEEHKNSAKKSGMLSSELSFDQAAIIKLLNKHKNKPLIKIIDQLEENNIHTFDPLLQENFSHQLFSFYFNQKKIKCVHLPCPTKQETIKHAEVVKEFKAALNFLKNEGKKLLYINLQDRTSWREYARCKAIEDLLEQECATGSIAVISLPKDTEGYHQLPPYLNEKHADKFLQNLKMQVFDEEYGFCFDEKIKEDLSKNNFLEDLLAIIHRIFFHNKNVLLQEHRLDFIEIFYFFITLKILEITKADFISFSCKDGVDLSSTAAAEMLSFLKLLQITPFAESDVDQINEIINGPALKIRERSVSLDRFKRMNNAIKAFETIKLEYGPHFKMLIQEAFGRFFTNKVLDLH